MDQAPVRDNNDFDDVDFDDVDFDGPLGATSSAPPPQAVLLGQLFAFGPRVLGMQLLGHECRAPEITTAVPRVPGKNARRIRELSNEALHVSTLERQQSESRSAAERSCKANEATIDNDAIIDHQDTCKYKIKYEHDEAIRRTNDHKANAQSAEEAQQETTDVSHLSRDHLCPLCFPMFDNQSQKPIVSKRLHQPEYQSCAHLHARQL